MSAIIQSFLDDSYSNRLSFMKLSWADNWCKHHGIEYDVKEKYLHLKHNNNTSILINESQKIQFGEAYIHISLIKDEIVIKKCWSACPLLSCPLLSLEKGLNCYVQ